MNRLQLTRSKYRVRATEDTVDIWKALHREAMKVRDYETVLAECIQLASVLHETTSAITKEFLTGDPDALDANDRLEVVELSEQGACLFGTVITDGASLITADRAVESFVEAKERLERLRQANLRLRLTCPAADLMAIDSAREDVKRGNSLSFEEAFPDALSGASA